jgi:NADPH-dependent 2,4-dienoyl-CoA reductase/sulfur reductase-like enzyme
MSFRYRKRCGTGQLSVPKAGSVAIIGTGFGGLAAAVRLKQAGLEAGHRFPDDDLRVLVNPSVRAPITPG